MDVPPLLIIQMHLIIYLINKMKLQFMNPILLSQFSHTANYIVFLHNIPSNKDEDKNIVSDKDTESGYCNNEYIDYF